MFLQYRPEQPLTETLRFLTDVFEHKDGSEQRACLRAACRTEYAYNVLVENGVERQRMENRLLGAQDAVWDIAVWTDTTPLTSDAASTDSVISCDTTTSDFRIGGKAVLYVDEDNYELVTVSDFDDSTLSVTALTSDWPAGTEVIPVREAIIPQPVKSSRYSTSLTLYQIVFATIGNDIDLFDWYASLAVGDTLTFSTLGFGDDTDKYVLDDPNAMGATLSESHDRRIQVVDNNTGKVSQLSYWDRSRRGSYKTFVVHSRRDLWAVRLLLHYLKGRQISFLLPTFAQDITPAGDVASAATSLTIVNTGFTVYAALREPRKYVRIEAVDGTKITREISGVVENDADTETITVTAAWGANVDQENIARITLIEKVRIDNDDINIVHTSANGDAVVGFPTKAVIE